MTQPLLILTPDEMRNRDGAVSPTINAGATVVSGQHGDAWNFAATTGTGLTLPIASIPGITPDRGTLLIRYRVNVTTAQNVFGIGSSTGTQSRFTINAVNGADRVQSGYRAAGGIHTNINMDAPRNTWTWHVFRWRGSDITHVNEDDTQDRTNATGGEFTGILNLAGTNRNLLVEGLLLFDRALTDAQIDAVINMGEWTWQGVVDALYKPPIVFTEDSGLAITIDEAFITDRNNRDMVPLGDALVADSIQTDADIDRAGSKRQMSISAQHGALEAGMWIAPFRTIIPEDGPIQRYQCGHYKLGIPGVMYDGSVLMDVGTPASHQTARGLDIIDDICGAPLQFTFYTPVKGRIMHDCVNLIQLATVGRIGPNLVTNGSFEDGDTGWSPLANGGTVLFGWYGNTGVRPFPHGKRSLLLETIAGAANATGGLAYQNVVIPANARYLMLSGLAMCAEPNRYTTGMRIEFRDSLGNEISRTETTIYRNGFWGEWQREVEVAEVPAGATVARVVFRVNVTNGGVGYPGDAAVIDDVQLRVIQRPPIDRSRINLPRDTTVATTRIQTMQGESIGYQAINADRMTATGHHAINTDLSGVIITSKTRDGNSGIPARTFGPGDIVDGVVDIPTVSTDIPNVFIAVKESFEEGTAPMFAFAYNENPHDPYSIYNAETIRAGNEIMVQDAVSQAELQAAADAARDRFSVQETIRFRIHADYDLTIYDLIAIDDPDMPNAQGVWAVESIADDGPLMVIGARRVLGAGE